MSFCCRDISPGDGGKVQAPTLNCLEPVVPSCREGDSLLLSPSWVRLPPWLDIQSHLAKALGSSQGQRPTAAALAHSECSVNVCHWMNEWMNDPSLKRPELQITSWSPCVPSASLARRVVSFLWAASALDPTRPKRSPPVSRSGMEGLWLGPAHRPPPRRSVSFSLFL